MRRRRFQREMTDNPTERGCFCTANTLKTGEQGFLFSQYGTNIYLKFKSYNLQSKTWVYKGVDFCVQNAVKLTYDKYLQFQKNFLGLYPRTPLKGRGDPPIAVTQPFLNIAFAAIRTTLYPKKVHLFIFQITVKN